VALDACFLAGSHNLMMMTAAQRHQVHADFLAACGSGKQLYIPQRSVRNFIRVLVDIYHT
jgi:hypothetical protein